MYSLRTSTDHIYVPCSLFVALDCPPITFSTVSSPLQQPTSCSYRTLFVYSRVYTYTGGGSFDVFDCLAGSCPFFVYPLFCQASRTGAWMQQDGTLYRKAANRHLNQSYKQSSTRAGIMFYVDAASTRGMYVSSYLVVHNCNERCYCLSGPTENSSMYI